MRKLIFFILISFTLSLGAQVDPLTQFFNKAFVPTLVEYDSISVSSDTGTAFTAIAHSVQHNFPNGHIDTLEIFQMGSPVLYYDGILTGRTTTVTGYAVGTTQPIEEYVYKQDSLYRDSTFEYYTYSSPTSKALQFEARMFYGTNGKAQNIDIYADVNGNIVKVGDYNYFYNSNSLPDSVYYTVSLQSNSDGYNKYTYSNQTAGKLTKMENYQDMNNNGERDLFQVLTFRHNQLNQVDGIVEAVLDQNNNWQTAEYHYGRRKNSTISLEELAQKSVSIYPNPASDQLNLDLEKDLFDSFEIINMSGQVVKNGDVNSLINLEDLNTGAYILRLKGETSMSVKFQKS